MPCCACGVYTRGDGHESCHTMQAVFQRSCAIFHSLTKPRTSTVEISLFVFSLSGEVVSGKSIILRGSSAMKRWEWLSIAVTFVAAALAIIQRGSSPIDVASLSNLRVAHPAVVSAITHFQSLFGRAPVKQDGCACSVRRFMHSSWCPIFGGMRSICHGFTNCIS